MYLRRLTNFRFSKKLNFANILFSWAQKPKNTTQKPKNVRKSHRKLMSFRRLLDWILKMRGRNIFWKKKLHSTKSQMISEVNILFLILPKNELNICKKSVQGKNTVMQSLVLSKLWSFSITHQQKSKQSQLMYYWKYSWFW